MASLQPRVGTPIATVYLRKEGIRDGRQHPTKQQDAIEQLGQGIRSKGLEHVGQGIEPEWLGHQEAGPAEVGAGPEQQQQPHDAVEQRVARVE